MLEFIGFITLCFFGYKILILFLRKKNAVSNSESGFEIRNFSIDELGVPSNYFNYITSSKIEDIKKKALYLKENNFKDSSWPMLMAISIYLFFYEDCKKTEYESNAVMDFLKIDPTIIKKELELDPYKIINYFINAKKDYEFATNDQITNLIVESSKIDGKNISYKSSIYERMSRYADDNWYSHGHNEDCVYFYAESIDDNIYSVVVKAINYEEGREGQANLIVEICNDLKK